MVLAFCLLSNEQGISLKWFLETLKQKLGALPKVVFTDDDPAFHGIFTKYFSMITRFLCIHHIYTNFYNNKARLGKEYHNFMSDFTRVRNMLFVEGFTEGWDDLLYTYPSFASYLKKQLGGDKVRLWARCYMTLFTFDLNTTSRVEGINSAVVEILNSKSTLMEMFLKLDKLIQQMDYEATYGNVRN